MLINAMMPLGVLAVAALVTTSAVAQDVTTYKGDALRTGWYSHERTLTPATAPMVRQVWQTALGDASEIQGQPLVINGSVVVATQGDNLYRLDLATGAILAQRSLGQPVSVVPPSCTPSQFGPQQFGITSTPVYDPAQRVLYFISLVSETGQPVMRLHAVDPMSFVDLIPAVQISAQETLADGSTYQFDPLGTRQRTGLLLSGGNIYAGFFAHCDFRDAREGRGWLMGWRASDLTPIEAHLDNRRAHGRLTDLWMSGS